MSEATVLRGMTWDHSRGYDPLHACAAEWAGRTGVTIEWDRRSLQDFESFPVEELARRYDLIVIDHPHVGQVTRENCLRPFEGDLSEFASGSVGASFDSYRWEGRQWGLPIDAATQVLAWRPDRLPAAPSDWIEVLNLAQQGKVAIPMRAPHSLMSLYTLVAQAGSPAAVTGPDLFDVDAASEVIAFLAELMRHVDPVCYSQDPIAVFEDMARADSPIACVPLIYGYVNYAWQGFRPARLAFADIPSRNGRGPVGSALGGTGIAVSAFSPHGDKAEAFARWVAGGAAQCTPFASAGGQPGHAAAWEDDTVNADAGDFYRATRATLEGAWVRPRHDGYMPFQHAASERLSSGLQAGDAPEAIVADINRLFRECLP